MENKFRFGNENRFPMQKENLVFDLEPRLKKENQKFDFELNKEKINKEINFRNHLEIDGLWEDKKLLDFRDDLGQNEQKNIQRAPLIEATPGDVEGLSAFLAKEQQTDAAGRIRYLLTSGLAVEVITGVTRHHHDMDLVLFDFRNGWWLKYATDNVTADRYWADMSFDPEYLEQTAWTAQFQTEDNTETVLTVHPAIILVQKLSDAWGRPPRERDRIDVVSLIRYWQESHPNDPSWSPILAEAIAALPKSEQARTEARLTNFPQL